MTACPSDRAALGFGERPLVHFGIEERSRLDHQRDPRCEQQRRLVEAPEQFQAKPGADE